MKVMLTGMSLSDVEFNMAIARSRPQQVRTTIGIHPYHASEPYSEEGHFDRLAGAVHDALKAKPSLSLHLESWGSTMTERTAVPVRSRSRLSKAN